MGSLGRGQRIGNPRCDPPLIERTLGSRPQLCGVSVRFDPGSTSSLEFAAGAPDLDEAPRNVNALLPPILGSTWTISRHFEVELIFAVPIPERGRRVRGPERRISLQIP